MDKPWRLPDQFTDREISAEGPLYDDDDVPVGYVIVSNFGVETYDLHDAYLGLFPAMEQATAYVIAAARHDPIVRRWN